MNTLDTALGALGLEMIKAFQRYPDLLKEFEAWKASQSKGGESNENGSERTR
jgi:hypothetical protein